MDDRNVEYQQLFQNAPCAIVYVGLDGTPRVVNERAARVFGYDSGDDFVAGVSSMLSLWVDPAARHRAAEIMLATGVLRDHEVVMKRRDGSSIVLAVSANPWYDPGGHTIGIQLTGIEITDRVAAEQRLEEAQAQAAIGFWSWRRDTNELWKTREVLRILGADSEIGASLEYLQALIHPEDRDVVAMSLAAFRRVPGERFEMEFRIVTDAGETRWLCVRGRLSDDGLEIAGSVQDVTKQKAVEEKLKELNDMKTEFVGVVAHDLRSPLTVASGYTEFLAEQWDQIADPERKQLVDNVARSLDRLGSLVADVLEVTRLEAGVATEDIRPFDLEKLVRSAVDELGSIAPDRMVHLTIADRLPRALADRDAIWRVLTNLLSNALKYSPASEPITVEVVHIGNELRVAIRDRGSGIAPADQSRLFQKFSRVSSNGAPRPEGTGLGLYICKSLVESCGGSIWLESAVGVGSVFYFTLPAHAIG